MKTYNPDPIVVKHILKLQTHLGPPLSCPGVGVVRKHRVSGGPGLELTGITTGYLLISVTQLLYHFEAALGQTHKPTFPTAGVTPSELFTQIPISSPRS